MYFKKWTNKYTIRSWKPWEKKFSSTVRQNINLQPPRLLKYGGQVVFIKINPAVLFWSVFQDRIYWTDRDRAALFMANRLSGQDIQTLAENLNDPHDIVVFHQLRQPQGGCFQFLSISVCRRLISIFSILAVIVWTESHLCDSVSAAAPWRLCLINKWCPGFWLRLSDRRGTFTHLS